MGLRLKIRGDCTGAPCGIRTHGPKIRNRLVIAGKSEVFLSMVTEMVSIKCLAHNSSLNHPGLPDSGWCFSQTLPASVISQMLRGL